MPDSLSKAPLSPADRSVSGLNEFPFLFITRWCPAAPVNTFLQQAIHRYTLAAETPVMNFNLLSAEGAAPRVGLIKGNTPSRGRGRGHTDRLSPSYPHNYPLIAPVPQAGAYECGKHLPDTPRHCCALIPFAWAAVQVHVFQAALVWRGNFICIFKGLWYDEAFTMLSAITHRKCLLPQVLIIFKLEENTPWGQFLGLRILLNPFYSWLLAARCTGWRILGVECRPDRVMFNMSTGNQFTLTPRGTSALST